jgi:cytochrome P450 family 135
MEADRTIPATALPGPRMHPLRQAWVYWKRPAAFLEDCRERYGSRFALSIRIPPKPLYVLTDHEDVKQMFMAPRDVLHSGRGSVTLEKFFGRTGLAWLDEDAHTTRRRQLLPSVRGDALRRIEASIAVTARQEVATWPRGRAMPLHPRIHRVTLNVIRDVVFGSAPPSCWPELLDVLQGMMRLNDHVASVLTIHKMSPAAVGVLSTIPQFGLGDFLKLRKRANALIAEAVEERRASGELGDDMLGVLLGISKEDGSPLSAVELRDEMMTMFLAGSETTAAGLSWALEYLTREDEARERLLAEIESGDGDAYLTATVQEVLRLRPPLAILIPRQVMKPIEIGGVRYERGMVLMACPHLLHRDESLYEDPEAFRPERFLGARPGTYTWVPFGGGATHCLGLQIGVYEMKAVLREILSQHELHRPDLRPEPVRSRIVVTVPAKGARLELRAKGPSPVAGEVVRLAR